MNENNLSVKARNGAVVSIDKYATEVGVNILKQGGNAIDAAVATAFALAVTHPFAGNIGGGGFMLIRLASGEEVAIDFREMAPAAATATMFLTPEKQIDYNKANLGYLAAGVPGTVKGLEAAWQKYGSLAWYSLLAPAIQLARKGIYLNKYDVAALQNHGAGLAQFPETRKIFFKPNGQTYGSHDLLVQPDLANTLQQIAQYGSDAFYHGYIAEQIAADFVANGGVITKADLSNYEVKIREPIKSYYQGYDIICMPLPSAGGITLLKALNILENFELNKQNPLDPENLHLLIETMRYVSLDRVRYLGDADFVQVPVARLLAKSDAHRIAQKINLSQATPSQTLSGPVAVYKENMETTHFSVIDQAGNMVATTVTLEDGFGSKAVVKNLGFLLNSEMHDFNINPQETNMQGGLGSNPNGIAPGKRMLSSMSPTLVLKDNKPFLITGSPGGRTIFSTVLQVIMGVTTYNLSLIEAMRLPRLSHLWMPDWVHVEKLSWDGKILAALAAKGHFIKENDYLGDAHSIWIDPKTGLYEAVADFRRYGWAAGY